MSEYLPTRGPAQSGLDQDGEFGSAAPSSASEGTGVAGVPDAAMRVGGTVRDETAKVAGELKDQAADLAGTATRAVKEQAGVQQQRAAENLRTLSGQFDTMADSADSGLAVDIVRAASSRVDIAARWLEGREPGDLVEDVKTFARNRPGLFIAIAVGAGILAGRLTRSVSQG